MVVQREKVIRNLSTILAQKRIKKNVKKPDIENNLFDKYLDYMSIDRLKKKQGYNKENVKKKNDYEF